MTLVERVWRELVVGVGPSEIGCCGWVVVYSSILVCRVILMIFLVLVVVPELVLCNLGKLFHRF